MPPTINWQPSQINQYSSIAFNKVALSTPPNPNLLQYPATNNLTPLFGIMGAISEQLHKIQSAINFVSETVGFSFQDSGYPKAYLPQNTTSSTVIQLQTSTGLVTIPQHNSLHDALESPYFGWYYENGDAIVTNIGVKLGTIVSKDGWSYITNTDRDPILPVYVICQTGTYILKAHEVGTDGLLPFQNVTTAYYYVYTDMPDLNFVVDGLIVTLSAYDLTNPSYLSSFAFNLPFTDYRTSCVNNAYYYNYVHGQTKDDVETALSLAYNQYTTVSCTFGATGYGNPNWPEKKLDVVVGRSYGIPNINKYVNYMGIDNLGNPTDNFNNSSATWWHYIRNKFSGPTYEYYDRIGINPGVTTQITNNYDIIPVWNDTPYGSNLNSSSFI